MTIHDPEAQRQALIHSVSEAYMEIFPTDTIEERLKVLPRNAYVAVTCSPTKGVEATLDLSERLIKQGFRVVPHIAAKMVRDDAHLREILKRLDDHPIDSLFVPGGDAPKPIGKFATAFELLRAISEYDHKFNEIGVAAHPEGHPAVSPDLLLRELEKKQPYATYLVTQMCFDANALGLWLEDIRRRGITLPAWLGMPGEADRSSLVMTSMRIGVGDSLRYLRRHGKIASQMLKSKTYRPNALLKELAPWLADPAMLIKGHHIYCFNQVERAETWRHQFLAELRNAAPPP